MTPAAGSARAAQWEFVRSDADLILIRDVGPWDRHPTITNDAANVVRELAPHLRGRRLFYTDSLGHTDELLVVNGKFAGFRTVAGLVR